MLHFIEVGTLNLEESLNNEMFDLFTDLKPSIIITKIQTA